MVNYKPKHGDMEIWLIVAAMGKDTKLIDKMKKNEDGSYPVIFSVGGVELDFNLVARRIDESINAMVADKAKSLLCESYGNLLDEINEIQERIESQKEIFRYDWENTN